MRRALYACHVIAPCRFQVRRRKFPDDLEIHSWNTNLVILERQLILSLAEPPVNARVINNRLKDRRGILAGLMLRYAILFTSNTGAQGCAAILAAESRD